MWQVIRAARSARTAESRLDADEVLDLVTDTTGGARPLVQAAIAYWAAFPTEIDALILRPRKQSHTPDSVGNASTACSPGEAKRSYPAGSFDAG